MNPATDYFYCEFVDLKKRSWYAMYEEYDLLDYCLYMYTRTDFSTVDSQVEAEEFRVACTVDSQDRSPDSHVKMPMNWLMV